ncbi:hypothetical protein M409DRAFT_53163 [Zasmidium cellare ATCC 36951]|uniref:Uncharacterized protein n=1 Tax=Zasmidium cellare ATCC 36951 TaxID=1080233 RepID=A0A6A6CML8_ZASCE|nr:uncharacterized protein M409DRAFT_53163 [Zasmidium cellare ATCC 36951]KAF2168497.1 hypothetical protein M409DRAFT_53163 [Zasmidium cellare ATCC 36951]
MSNTVADAMNELLDMLIDYKPQVHGSMGYVQTYQQLEAVLVAAINNTAGSLLPDILSEIHLHVDDNNDNGELRWLLARHVNEAPRLTTAQQVRLREILAGMIGPAIEADEDDDESDEEDD